MAGKRVNGEGSIYPYRSGFAAYVWVTTPAGQKRRKYVYGKTREAVYGKWVQLKAKAANPDLSSGLMAGAEGRLAPFAATILAPGYDGGPAGGPGGRGFHKPRGCSSRIAGMGCAGQGACGSASIRCHAVVIASAHGQVAWIFRRRRRPPRTSRAAACSTR